MIATIVSMLPIIVGYVIIFAALCGIIVLLVGDEDPWPFGFEPPFNMDEGDRW